MDQLDQLIYEYEEEAMATAIGLRLELVHQTRANGMLRRGVDWILADGKVWHTIDSAAALLGFMNVTMPRKKKKGKQPEGETLEDMLERARAPHTPPRQGARRVSVFRINANDRQSLTATLMDTGESVRVMVGDNRNLLPGMEIEVIAYEGSAEPSLFSMIGPAPKSRGRW